VIVEDRHVERREPSEAGERVQRVEVVVEDRDAHEARGGRRRRDVSHAAKIISHAPISLKRLLGKATNSGRQEQGGREAFTSSDGDKQVELPFFGRDLRGLARRTWNDPP